MSFEPRDYLRHILLEAEYLIGQTGDLSYEAFVDNATLRRAFVRSLEIIGEARRRFHMSFVRNILRSNGGRWPGCVTV